MRDPRRMMTPVLRLDDREFVRDDLGRFATTGDAADHARDQASLAAAAAASTSSSSVKSRARKAQESANRAEVAHVSGDLEGATRHASMAETHAAAAVTGSGFNEWTLRARVASQRALDEAKASGDHYAASRAALDAARAFGATSPAGRRLMAESQRRAAMVERVTSPSPPKPVNERAKPGESYDTFLSRRLAEAKSSPSPTSAVFNPTDDFARRAAENSRAMARESVARERKAELDRQITLQHVTTKVVSLPPATVVRLPGAVARIGGAIRKALRGDSVSHVDRLRSYLNTKYGVDATRLDEAEVVRRTSTLLGPVDRASPAGALAVLALRADADEREYVRDEAGRFASTGAASDAAQKHAERARAVASGTTPSARASARRAEEHAALAKVAHEHGDLAGANHHAAEAQRHAQEVDRKVAGVVAPGERGLDRKQMVQEATGRGDRPAGVDSVRPRSAQGVNAPLRATSQVAADHARSVAQRVLSGVPKSSVNTTNMGSSPANAAVAKAAADRATANAKTPADHLVASAMRDAAVSAASHSDQHLADLIHQHAASAPVEARPYGHNDNQVFSHEIYDRMSPADKAKFGTLDQYKDKLVQLSRAGHVMLSRADARSDQDAAKLERSHISGNQAPGGRHREGMGSLALNYVEDKSRDFLGRPIGR